MPKDAIDFAIEDRLCVRWKKRCEDESAAPVCVIAIKQLAGTDFGTPVVCTTEDIPIEQLAALLRGISYQLTKRKKEGK